MLSRAQDELFHGHLVFYKLQGLISKKEDHLLSGAAASGNSAAMIKRCSHISSHLISCLFISKQKTCQVIIKTDTIDMNEWSSK